MIGRRRRSWMFEVSVLLALACATIVAAQIQILSLPSDIREILADVTAQDPELQVLNKIAIASLTTEQARIAIDSIRLAVAVLGRSRYLALAATLDELRRSLPHQRQQSFINGLWGTSLVETDYAATVIRIACVEDGNLPDECVLAGNHASLPLRMLHPPIGGYPPFSRVNPCYRCAEDNLLTLGTKTPASDCTSACNALR